MAKPKTGRWSKHGDRRDENVTYEEGRFKMCRKCRGTGSTRNSPQCPTCHGKGMI